MLQCMNAVNEWQGLLAGGCRQDSGTADICNPLLQKRGSNFQIRAASKLPGQESRALTSHCVLGNANCVQQENWRCAKYGSGMPLLDWTDTGYSSRVQQGLVHHSTTQLLQLGLAGPSEIGFHSGIDHP